MTIFKTFKHAQKFSFDAMGYDLLQPSLQNKNSNSPKNFCRWILHFFRLVCRLGGDQPPCKESYWPGAKGSPSVRQTTLIISPETTCSEEYYKLQKNKHVPDGDDPMPLRTRILRVGLKRSHSIASHANFWEWLRVIKIGIILEYKQSSVHHDLRVLRAKC